MAGAQGKLDPTEVSRVEAVRSAIASARLEGVEVTAATREAFDDYVSGAIDGDELVDRILGKYGRGA